MYDSQPQENNNELFAVRFNKDYLENLIIPKPLFKFDKSKYESDGYIVTQI